MSKRKRPEVGYSCSDPPCSENENPKDMPLHMEGELVTCGRSLVKESSSSVVDTDNAFVRNAAHCRKLQSEINEAPTSRVLPSTEHVIRKQQQNILWSLVQYVSRDNFTVNEDMFASVTELANDLVLSSVIRYRLETEPRKEEDWIDGWMKQEEDTKYGYYLDSALWSVHQLVYELLLQILLSQGALDTRIICAHWNVDMLKKLLNLFGSPDARERDYILSIVHVFYKTVVKFRRIIRKFVCIRIQCIVFEGEESVEGISEMLEFCCSIIRGFAVPLKREHEDFLLHCLLPLHKLANMESFYPPLLFCIMAYLEKNPCLAPLVLNYLFRCWPLSNSSKEVLFLNHLEEILAATPHNILETALSKATQRIGKCMASFHSHISHRAFLILENGQVWSHLLCFRERTFPILTSYVEKVISSHWNSSILQMASVWSQRLRTLNN